jgi:hypothetical protein
MGKIEKQLELEIVRNFARRTGAQGGRKAARNMTKAQRVARARKAAAARYAKEAGRG